MIAKLESKLGIIGDVHCENETLKKVTEFFQDQGIQSTVCVGDIVDGKGDVNETISILKKNNVITVLGNHDEWSMKNYLRQLPDATMRHHLSEVSIEFLSALPRSIVFESILGQVLLCHGLNDDHMSTVRPHDMDYALKNNDELQKLMERKEIQICICGHSHYRMVKTFGHVVIINAGTLYREHQPCFAILDFPKNELTFYDIRPNRDFIANKPTSLLKRSEV